MLADEGRPRLIDEQILHHQELKTFQRLDRMMHIGISDDRVFSHDVHGLELPIRGRVDHFRGREPGLGRERDAPRLFELLPDLRVGRRLVSGEVGRVRAGAAVWRTPFPMGILC